MGVRLRCDDCGGERAARSAVPRGLAGVKARHYSAPDTNVQPVATLVTVEGAHGWRTLPAPGSHNDETMLLIGESVRCLECYEGRSKLAAEQTLHRRAGMKQIERELAELEKEWVAERRKANE